MPYVHTELRFLLYVCNRKIGAPPPIFNLTTVQPPNGGKPSFPYANCHLNCRHTLLHVFDLFHKCNCALVSRFLSNFYPVILRQYTINTPKCCLTLQTVHATHHPKSVTAVTVESVDQLCICERHHCQSLSSVCSPLQRLPLLDVSL